MLVFDDLHCHPLVLIWGMYINFYSEISNDEEDKKEKRNRNEGVPD